MSKVNNCIEFKIHGDLNKSYTVTLDVPDLPRNRIKVSLDIKVARQFMEEFLKAFVHLDYMDGLK